VRHLELAKLISLVCVLTTGEYQVKQPIFRESQAFTKRGLGNIKLSRNIIRRGSPGRFKISQFMSSLEDIQLVTGEFVSDHTAELATSQRCTRRLNLIHAQEFEFPELFLQFIGESLEIVPFGNRDDTIKTVWTEH
jgi:hypothetical protein